MFAWCTGVTGEIKMQDTEVGRKRSASYVGDLADGLANGPANMG